MLIEERDSSTAVVVYSRRARAVFVCTSTSIYCGSQGLLSSENSADIRVFIWHDLDLLGFLTLL